MAKRQRLALPVSPQAQPTTKRPRRAKHAKRSEAAQPSMIASCSNLLNLPEELLERILCKSGSDAPALALSCKPFSSLWEGNTGFQAQWLFENSSSILVTDSTRPKLAKLHELVKVIPKASTKKLLWLKWALGPQRMGRCYGGCKGQHSDGSSCSFPLDSNWAAQQDALLRASASGDLKEAQCLIWGQTNVQANGNAALRAAASAGHLEMIDLLVKNGADANQGLVEGGSAYLEACKAGNISVVKQLSLRR